MRLNVNENTADRAIRIVLGLVLIVAAVAAGLTAPLLYVAWIVGGLALFTGAVGFCPLYAVLGISTCPVRR
jgi:hypothetical protein